MKYPWYVWLTLLIFTPWSGMQAWWEWHPGRIPQRYLRSATARAFLGQGYGLAICILMANVSALFLAHALYSGTGLWIFGLLKKVLIGSTLTSCILWLCILFFGRPRFMLPSGR